MENEFDVIDEKATSISSKQKGTITENRVSEIITLSSQGSLTCYTPNSDDDGIDLIINPKMQFKPLFVQIKSRFVLQKSGQFLQDVGQNTFVPNLLFHLLFVYFNQEKLEVEKIWLVPSEAFLSKAVKLKGGTNHKAVYRFTANPKSKLDKWAEYSVDKTQLGNKLLGIIDKIHVDINAEKVELTS